MRTATIPPTATVTPIQQVATPTFLQNHSRRYPSNSVNVTISGTTPRTPGFAGTNDGGEPTPLSSSILGVVDLYAGERWIPELGLYDLRNRFMSPELGRFLQPDPIGFKGDASRAGAMDDEWKAGDNWVSELKGE